MEKRVCIVHYNTPELTRAAIRSIFQHTPDCKVTVFENSDKNPLPPIDGVTVLDNTKGQLIDFAAFLAKYPERQNTLSANGSEKHIASVDYLFDVYPDGFLLLDSDVLVRSDLTPLFDETVAWVGEEEQQNFRAQIRVAPYLLWINVPMCRKYGIRFLHEKQIFRLSHNGPPWYDTGASFYWDCKNACLPVRQIPLYKYIIHFGSGSWGKKPGEVLKFLDHYKSLYCMEEPIKKTKKTTKLKADDRILVVIPYCSAGAQGHELEYAVAGWRMHFKENYLIVLAGENHPVTETGDDIICIESERVPPKAGQYRQHLDYVSCFKKVRAAFPNSKGFVFVADDCYAVNDFDMTDIMLLKQKADDMGGNLYSANGWQRDKAKTRALLVKEGYPTRNFTTHIPQWFEWDKLEALWEKYDMENESYVFEDLYYNIYFPTRIPLQLHIDHDNFKCGVYRSNPRLEYLTRALQKQIWIQNSPEGWIPALEKVLQYHYGI